MIEALVAILILSFGLLALGSFMAYGVQLPKLSGNRSVAMVAGADLVERMRANTSGTLNYANTTISGLTGNATNTFTATFAVPTSMPSGSTCAFPNCTAASLATMDVATVDFNLKRQLPSGGLTIQIPDTANAPRIGNVWVIWQEPSNFGTFSTSGSDVCPANVTALSLSPAPRCVYIPFRL